MKYCGNTTNLASHLKTQHPSIYMKDSVTGNKKGGEKQKYIALKDFGRQSIVEVLNLTTKFPASSKWSIELTKAVPYFKAKDMQPISVLQGAGFKHMIKAFEPRYQIPHRKTFTEKVLPEHFLKAKGVVASAVNKSKFFMITTDCWTSHANEAHMGVTFHTISEDWEHLHFTLQNKALPDQHTAETQQRLY